MMQNDIKSYFTLHHCDDKKSRNLMLENLMPESLDHGNSTSAIEEFKKLCGYTIGQSMTVQGSFCTAPIQ